MERGTISIFFVLFFSFFSIQRIGAQPSHPADTDYPFLFRLSRITDAAKVCVLLNRTGRYHFERLRSGETHVFEGSISDLSIQELKNAVGSEELLHLTQDQITVPLVSSRHDEVELRIPRVGYWQILRFPDAASRTPLNHSLQPLLSFLETLPTQKHLEFGEDLGENNCLPPISDVELTRRDSVYSSRTGSAAFSQSSEPKYLMRLLTDQLSPGKIKRTCVVVYLNGSYHMEKSRQTYYASGSYHPDVEASGGKVAADVFEQAVPKDKFQEFLRILDNAELKTSEHQNLPIGVEYNEAEITFLSIPRLKSIQELSFTDYLASTDTPQGVVAGPGTVLATGGGTVRHTDAANHLLEPIRKWFKANVENRKASRLKGVSGNNCAPVETHPSTGSRN